MSDFVEKSKRFFFELHLPIDQIFALVRVCGAHKCEFFVLTCTCMHGSSSFQSDCVKGGTRDKNILAACSTSCVPKYTTFTNTIHSTATVSSSGKVIADTLVAVSLGHLALLQESTRRLEVGKWEGDVWRNEDLRLF